MFQSLVLMLMVGAASSHAAPAPRRSPELRIPRVPSPPRIENYLVPSAHPYEAAISDFRQRQPGDGQAASESTTVYLSYDAQNLYAVFVCREDPARVRAHLASREAISEDDRVGIALDTFRDGRRAYVFFVNPLGVQRDGITTEGQEDDYEFDTVWHSDGRVFASGYAVLIAIPFRSLRFAGAGDSWGIALTRHIRRLNETSCWPYITDRLEGYVPQFALLTGIQVEARSRKIDVAPYASSGWQSEPGFAGQRRTREVRAGMDAKVVLHEALTMDVTLNPDFSQVESDEPQVSVNQRYEVYVPEKRPFFLENAGFFETPEPLFFSRRIVDPGFGARFSGKAGRWAMGALVADDRAEGTGPRARAAVARVERELPGGSTLGALFTERNQNGEWNRVAALDTRLKLNANLVFTGQMIRTQDHFEGHDASGTGMFAELRFSGRNAYAISSYRGRTPDFRAALGYVPRSDIRQASHSAGYRWRPEQGLVSNFGPSLRATATWNHAGQLQDWYAEVPFRVELRRATTFAASRWEAFERYEGASVRSHANTVYASSDFVRWMGFTAFYSGGTAVNYTPAPGLGPSSLPSREASLEVTVRPSARLRIDESYFYTRLGGDTPVLTNHLARSKANYQFSRALSIRAILDYNGVLANRALSSTPGEKRVSADVLLTYLAHPGTALYFGFATAARNLPGEDGNGFRTGSFRDGRSRLLFAKLTYRLRL